MKNIKSLAMLIMLSMSSALYAQLDTVGGESPEQRVDEIRENLLNWLMRGGAWDLELYDVNYKTYFTKMSTILQPGAVNVEFVEYEIKVNNKLKTCKSYFSEFEDRPIIKCNTSRFQLMSDTEQFQLIHHEYAGLVNIEENRGSISDYRISIQMAMSHNEESKRELVVKEENYYYGIPNFSCKVLIDGIVAFDGTKEDLPLPRKYSQEGYGYAEIIQKGPIKVFVINRPLQIVVSYDDLPGIPSQVKKSSKIKSIILGLKVTKLNTTIKDHKIKVECEEIGRDPSNVIWRNILAIEDLLSRNKTK